jgi:hypothetical protein
LAKPAFAAPKLNMNFPLARRHRDDDDETGARMEAASPDYYYRSLPWVIKTWLYFMTVVIPFGIVYWSFIGIFQSTAIQQIPIWKRVPFHNLLFLGMGCTLKSEFLARQALDSRGVLAKVKKPSISNNSSSNNINRCISRRKRGRSRGKVTNTSGLQRASSSFWDDFDRAMPKKSNSSIPKRGLERVDRHRSTMEIYQLHANDEKIGILSGGAGDGGDDD